MTSRTLYVLTLVLAVVCRFGAQLAAGLDQPLDALAKIKIVLLFVLFYKFGDALGGAAEAMEGAVDAADEREPEQHGQHEGADGDGEPRAGV